MGDKKSKEMAATGFSGGVRKYGGDKSGTYSHGTVWPAHKEYPPDRDVEGKPIDYSLARNGGIFKETYLRGTVIPVKTEVPYERPMLKNGAVNRYRDERNNSQVAKVWSGRDKTVPYVMVANDGTLSAKDSEILSLRATLKNLQSS